MLEDVAGDVVALFVEVLEFLESVLGSECVDVVLKVADGNGEVEGVTMIVEQLVKCRVGVAAAVEDVGVVGVEGP